ncbi:hypothetical protein ETB97_007420 [Aspergillus alliaceus]|uniref:DUF202 domain-containing protein n=1 Tax=Petromyces alliaceus TaxID=209559 RepID=A0A5N6FHP2_PETAA|nr:uncharacterized protein BDW43DRAFT_187807 [Aspergillus alliaceus]KAB8229461.1 hypothetical protein BDW43DRAFT_187807 [Aspergillus alliaceus]KAE8391610.1 hypothetical protein BDV23DRAFT_69295 [Aspergillus alliaceus]KAF5856423.1 hypothetical protein ETB97_007420 [Aspergillus burnettii]
MFSRIHSLLFPKAVTNTGSQLRDHLANERTFLSWTRMGLAFAAMGLALGRLSMIDHVFNTQWNNQRIESSNETAKLTKPTQRQDTEREFKSPGRNDILASQFCWTISVWSFGYGICRYVSVRRTLLLGRFVPAIWGPVLMTCGSLGSLGVLLQSDLGPKSENE